MGTKEHWERVYTTKSVERVSWYQAHAEQSLRMIRGTGAPKTAAIIDVGGGASTLVDDLLDDGYARITVLDISSAALAVARERLGDRAGRVTWIEADITTAQLPRQHFAIWHDRAVFHFLTSPADRRAYVQVVTRSVQPGGHVIVAAFSDEGPLQCSGLDVMRYGSEQLHDEFGSTFELVESFRESHRTPAGTIQEFVYCYCRLDVEPR